jgi:hypothetical protein
VWPAWCGLDPLGWLTHGALTLVVAALALATQKLVGKTPPPHLGSVTLGHSLATLEFPSQLKSPSITSVMLSTVYLLPSASQGFLGVYLFPPK